MTHEFKTVLEIHLEARKIGLKSVLATVVYLEGSSYRKPGVRMLVLENGKMIGAVSGGCVERDIARESQEVFATGKPKMMQYDGRYRLGCEGILHILLEPFSPSEDCVNLLTEAFKSRQNFIISSKYLKDEGINETIGSYLSLGNRKFNLSGKLNGFKATDDRLFQFEQLMKPCFKLLIFGGEHDAVVLCKMASQLGWEVGIVTPPSEAKTKEDFPGAGYFATIDVEQLDLNVIDRETFIVVMSHNFSHDLKYIKAISNHAFAYLGLLGPAKRREKLLSQLMELEPEIAPDFLDHIHGPAGLDIGAETPQEIALSILSEILTVSRGRKPISLKDKKEGIHA